MDIKDDVSKLYDLNGFPISKRTALFTTNLQTLVNLLAQKFVYTGLPDTLPATEIENRLLLTGHALILYNPDNNNNELITSYSSLYGIDVYNKPYQYTAVQAGLTKMAQGIIGVSAVVIYASTVDYSTPFTISPRFKMLRRFAQLLTDIDLSVDSALINDRSINAVVAKTTQAHEQLTDYYKRLIDGEYVVPFVNTGILDMTDDLHKTQSIHGMTAAELYEFRKNVLKEFYTSNGIQVVKDKAERMITDEINADNDYLESNTRDELAFRQKGIAEVNKLFGTNINVEVNNYVSYDVDNRKSDNSAPVEQLRDI